MSKEKEISACDHCHRLMNNKNGKVCSIGYVATPWKVLCDGFEKNRKLEKKMNKRYEITIMTTYSNLDKETLDDYLKNVFAGKDSEKAINILKKKGVVKKISKQPDGDGVATTVYRLCRYIVDKR